MTSDDDWDSSIAIVLRELDALCDRLDQAPNWLRDSETSMQAAALAGEVRQLCQQASLSESSQALHDLIETAKQRLKDLQTLLGLH